MNTTYDEIITLFCFKMKNDPDFFYYNNISNKEATELTKEICLQYLDEAIVILLLNCEPDIDFNNRDDKEFHFEMTLIEKRLLINLMYEAYLKEGFNRLKSFEQWYTTKELNTFSPANERTSFLKTYSYIQVHNYEMIRNYSSKDRKTGKLKTIDYSNGVFPSNYV